MMIRSRIAPTPSGYLHIGNALNFILTWLWVRRAGGTLRLRIDDCDTLRSKQEYVDDIFRTLDWMGMDWDEGPQAPDEETRIFSQSLRSTRYQQIIDNLIKTGMVYSCDCSRKSLQTQPCRCRERSIPLDQPDTALHIITSVTPVIVHDVKAGAIPVNLSDTMKDFVIRRRDGVAAYQIVSLADDADYGINHIIRGDDLISSTAAQLYLASVIGLEKFTSTTFYHHPLLFDEQGHKLSKSSGSLSLKTMREAGMTREKLYTKVSGILKLPQHCTSLDDILKSNFNI